MSVIGGLFMGGIKDVFAREMLKSGAKVIHGNMNGNVSPVVEWIKWLSYESEFEKQRIKYLHSKRVSELSYEELEEASIYSRNKTYARLFKIYDTSECSYENSMRVYDFMCNESIEELMLSKLSTEELHYAKQEIAKLREIPREQLQAKIKEERKIDTYNQLSMVDAYILHIICGINYAREMSSANKELKAQLDANVAMKQKSFYNSENSHVM